MAQESPQSRATKMLRAEGYEVEVVEHINRWGPITKRHDLFNAFDLLAVNSDGDIRALQVTSRSNVSARVKKLADLPVLDWLRKAEWKLEIWGWGPTVKSGDWKIVDVS